MDISKDLIRGHTDTIILNILSQGDSYGYQVSKSIRSLSDNQYSLNEATLYTAFRRLEKIGEIESYWGDETQGARRKYYKITSSGRQHLAAALNEWQFAKNIISHLISGEVTEGDNL
ncbi:helix-turn-helix transcriptional regulator [Leuconostoc carnosum]|uniref:PadR family transcriptional regulator n=1 Tax=Leuconostoc carnosum TaxID=1252 RepID=UPI00123B534F|nr:PadR family transcriptional regulator [Leuconostoc carnosum]KAA8369512.1 helix-turn-helix transcriptional regulator [Leuconostoc carnosum]KAA8380530.1 helix-turn-helix transcriptional regulator [Leuconostoc carnosum]